MRMVNKLVCNVWTFSSSQAWLPSEYDSALFIVGSVEQFASRHPTKMMKYSRYIFEATSSKFLMETQKVRIADDTQTGRNRGPVLFVGNHNQLLIEYQLYVSGSRNDLWSYSHNPNIRVVCHMRMVNKLVCNVWTFSSSQAWLPSEYGSALLIVGSVEQFASQYPTRWWSLRYIFEATSSKFLLETQKVRIADDTQTGRNRDPVLFVGNHNQLLIEYQLYLSGSRNDLWSYSHNPNIRVVCHMRMVNKLVCNVWTFSSSQAWLPSEYGSALLIVGSVEQFAASTPHDDEVWDIYWRLPVPSFQLKHKSTHCWWHPNR